MDEQQRSYGGGASEEQPQPPLRGSVEEISLPPAGTPVDVGRPGPALTAVPARRGLRWAIALLVTALVLAVGAGAFLALTGSAQTFATATYAPADSLFYAGVRTDLPGDQRQNVMDFLAHFPGFADQSTFDQKIDESLDRLFKSASGGATDYTTTFKPWLGNEIGFAITRLPRLSSGATESPSPGALAPAAIDSGGFVAVVEVKDVAAAQAWFASTVKQSPVRTESHAGVSVNVYGPAASGSAGGGGQLFAEAITGQVMLVGDLTSVEAALDAKGGGGLAATSGYQAARATVSGDRVGWVYVATKGYLDAVLARLPSAASPPIDAATLQKIPAWMELGLRFESNALVVDGAVPGVTGKTTATNSVSQLAPKLPGSTVAVVEAHSLGSTLTAGLAALRAQSGTSQGAQQLNDALTRLGGVDSLLGWMGDAALAVTRDGSGVAGGLVISAPDAATADAKLTQLKNLFALASLGGSGVATREETYVGTTITVVDLGDLSNIGPLLGSSLGGASLPVQGHVELAMAQHDGLVVLGVGDGFVKAVLDTKAGSSLADTARYKAALAAAGASNTGQWYVDIAAAMDAVEGAMPASARSQYDKETKPYVQHIQAFAATGSAGDPVRFRIVLTVQ